MARLLMVTVVLTIAAAIAHGIDIGTFMLAGIAAAAFVRAAAACGRGPDVK